MSSKQVKSHGIGSILFFGGIAGGVLIAIMLFIDSRQTNKSAEELDYVAQNYADQERRENALREIAKESAARADRLENELVASLAESGASRDDINRFRQERKEAREKEAKHQEILKAIQSTR